MGDDGTYDYTIGFVPSPLSRGMTGDFSPPTLEYTNVSAQLLTEAAILARGVMT